MTKRTHCVYAAPFIAVATLVLNGCGSEDDSDASATGGTAGSGAAGGGVSGNGGVPNGGSGGGVSSGGASGGGGVGAGGISGSGGTAGSGGVPPEPTPACALSPERIRVTEVTLGGTVVADENEAELHPLVISPMPSGGARLAWMGEDGLLHITTLDANDQVTGTEVTLAVNDFSDLYADDGGGVVLATRNAAGSGARYCGTLTNLCGNVSSLPDQHECWDMYMIRFDGTTETWATQLTESSTDLPPYLSSPTDDRVVRFIWWYAHHGRIAFDGQNYAGYYGSAVSLSQDCVNADSTLSVGVNIHQGDRMNVVGPTGEIVAGLGSFDWGCSHSGYERIVWDPGASRFVTVCKTDNQNRIALAPRYSTIRPVDLGASNLGDLALATGGGYWLSASDIEPAGGGNADVFLLRFSVLDNDATLNDEVPVANQAGLNERAPHLAAYGTDGLLVAWETSSSPDDIRQNDTSRTLYVQVRDRSTGAAVGEALPVTGVTGNRYHEFRAFPDGSAAFPARGTSTGSVRIVRVLPCDG